MEHWLVVIGEGQSDAALDWAAWRAEGCAALEVIASGLEVRDHRGAILHAAEHLQTASSRIPRAFHTVPTALVDEFARCDSVDLIVLGLSSGPLDRAEVDRLFGLLTSCRTPVVLVPGDAPGADFEPRVFTWPAAGRRPPRGLRAELRSGRNAVRVERSPVPGCSGR